MVQTYENVYFGDSVIIDNDDDRIIVWYRRMNAYIFGDSVIIDNDDDDDDRIFVWYRHMKAYIFGYQ